MASDRGYGKFVPFNEPLELGLNRVQGFEIHDGGCGRLVYTEGGEGDEKLRKLLAEQEIDLKESVDGRDAKGRTWSLGHRGDLFIDVYNQKNISCGLVTWKEIIEKMEKIGVIHPSSFLKARLKNGWHDNWTPETTTHTEYPEGLNEKRLLHYMVQSDLLTDAMKEWVVTMQTSRKLTGNIIWMVLT